MSKGNDSYDYKGNPKVLKFSGDAAAWGDFRTSFSAEAADKSIELPALLKKGYIRPILIATPTVQVNTNSDLKAEFDASGASPQSSDLKDETVATVREGDFKKWQLLNTRLYYLLTKHTKGKALDTCTAFEEEEDGLAAWKALYRLVEKTGDLEIADQRSKFWADQLGATEDPIVYFLRIEKRVRTIKALGGKIDENDTDKLTLTHNQLKKLAPYVTLMPTIREKARDKLLSYDSLKAMVVDHYEDRASHKALFGNRGGDGPPQGRGNLKGRGRGRVGRGGRGDFYTKHKGICHFPGCGEQHLIASCPKLQAAEAALKSSGQGSGGSATANPTPTTRQPCSRCQSTDHGYFKCPQRPPKAAQAAVAWDDVTSHNACIVINNPMTVQTTKTKWHALAAHQRSADEWIMDSGCDMHMVETSDGVTNIQPTTSVVLVGGKKELQASGTGTMQVTAVTCDGRTVGVTLEVLVVPGLGFALFSINRLISQRGNIAQFEYDESYIRFKETGDRINLTRKGGMFTTIMPLRQQHGFLAREEAKDPIQRHPAYACAALLAVANRQALLTKSFDLLNAPLTEPVDESTTWNSHESRRRVIDAYRDDVLARIARASPTTDSPTAHTALVTVAAKAKALLYHRRFCHRLPEDMQRLAQLNVGVPDLVALTEVCEPCMVSKMTKHSFPRSVRDRTRVPFGLVHCDIYGPVDKHKDVGRTYAVVFTDDATRHREGYYMGLRSELFVMLKRYIGDIARLVNKKWTVKRLHSDNGKEIFCNASKEFCTDKGIQYTTTGTYCPQQNGIAERGWRTLAGCATAMIEDAQCGYGFWTYSVDTIVKILNVTPTSALPGNITPHKALFGEEAQVGHIKVFGSRAYVLFAKKQGKFRPVAWKGMFVGYDKFNRHEYRIYNPEADTVTQHVHVRFDESTMFYSSPGVPNVTPHSAPALPDASDPVGEIADEESDADLARGDTGLTSESLRTSLRKRARNAANEREEARTPAPVSQDSVGAKLAPASMGDISVPLPPPAEPPPMPNDTSNHKSSRGRAASYCQREECELLPKHRAHVSSSGYDLAHALICHALASSRSVEADSGKEPKTYKQAIESHYAPQWQISMTEEYNSLIDNGTFDLVVPPGGANILNSMWVYKYKRDQTGKVVRYKSRLVAKGFSQEAGLDYNETYAPVAHSKTVLLILALAAVLGWFLHNMDVDTAFLNAVLAELVYMRQPPGYDQKGPNGERLVCRLKRSLYGLKQSPRNWNTVINVWLIEYGLKQSQADPCLYIKKVGKEILVIVLYVDDLLITGSNMQFINHFKKAIGDRFKMKDLGELRWMLGMEIVHNKMEPSVTINQTAYLEQILERFHISAATHAPATVPMVKLLHPRTDQVNQFDYEYAKLVGSLMYLSIISRPDISFAVQSLSKHMQNPDDTHWKAGMHLLRYLLGTKTKSLILGRPKLNEIKLVGYADSDYGGDRDNYKSVTGYVFMLAGGPVSWISKQQPTIATSSTHAEYIALYMAVCEAIHLRLYLAELGFSQDATTIYEDNDSCIAISKNNVSSSNIKHFNIKYHFTRECILNGEITVVYIPTKEQIADIFTKPLVVTIFEYLRSKLLGGLKKS